MERKTRPTVKVMCPNGDVLLYETLGTSTEAEQVARDLEDLLSKRSTVAVLPPVSETTGWTVVVLGEGL